MAAAVATSIHPQEHDVRQVYQDKFENYLKKVEETSVPEATSRKTEVGHSKNGQVIPFTIIDSPADWKSSELSNRQDEFTYKFSPSDVAELLRAVEAVKAKGVQPLSEEDVQKLTGDDFELPTLRSKIHQLGKDVSLGRGFAIIRGFPVEQFKDDRLGLIVAYIGLAKVLGTLQVSQTDYTEDGQTFVKSNPAHVQPKALPRTTRLVDLSRLPFHSDQAASDLVALLSVTAAKQGGESKWVSGLAIHNELLRRGRKDLVEALADPEGWKIPVKHDQSTYKRKDNCTFQDYENMPPFHYHDGYLSIYFQSNNYQEVELTPLQEEAIWTFAKLAEDPEFHYSVKLEPGDVEILHNATVLHSRGDVTDGEKPEEKRHLLRWWVAQPADRIPRPISKYYAPRSNVSPGGGFRVPGGSKLRLPFWPYSRFDGNGQSPY